MKTEFLKSLNLSQEVIDKIMAENGKDIAVEQKKAEKVIQERDSYKLKAESLETQVNDANTEIQKFKDMDIDGIKKAADDWKETAEKAKADADKQISQMKFDYALSAALTGAKAKNRNLSKTIKKICANLVKTAKKQLKIKSPSRVFKRIGVYNIQGAEKGHEAEAPRLYRQVENVSETLAERFAKANLKVSLPDIAGRTQAALSRQVSKVSASIQPQLTAALAGDAGQTIYNGPEKIELVTNLDGREIARTSVPYIDAYLGNMAARKARGGV